MAGKSRKLLGKLFILAGTAVVLALFLGIAREYQKRKELDAEISTLEQELANLQVKKKKFLSSLEAYQEEFYLEQEARMKFNLKKSGEKVAVIPVPSMIAKKAEPEQAEKNVLGEKNILFDNPRAWWNYFFGKEG